MGLNFHLICAECRETVVPGDVWFDPEPPARWRIDFQSDGTRHEVEYFLLAHRGHVLGMVDDWAEEDASSDNDPIVTTRNLAELIARHPELDLEDAERLAAPSPLLERLLRPGGIHQISRAMGVEDPPTA